MSSTSTGLTAESRAAIYLEGRGLRILARNWRNRWCEIDLVAVDKQGDTHIVEVKYRRSIGSGTGFEYITPAKIERLRRAAGAWMLGRKSTAGIQIDIISISGDLNNPTIEYLPNAVD